MSFLLFAARKMQLKREINANSYEQIKVQDQLKAAQKRVSNFQEQMTQMKNMTSIFARSLQAQATVQGYQDAGIDYNNTQSLQDNSAKVSTIQQGATALASTFQNVTDSIFTAVNNVQLEALKAESDRLDNKLTSLKTEAQLLNAECQEYDQAISSSVKEAAPKFGLA